MDPYIPFLWSGTLVSSQLVLYEILYSGINSCHTNFSFRNSLFWYGIRPSLWKLRVNIPTFLLSYTLVSAVKLIFTYIYPYLQLPDGSAGKESACNAGDLCLIPGLERTPGEGNSKQNFLHAIFLHENFFLPENSHGEWILVDYSPKGCKELDMTEQLNMKNDSYLQINSLCVYCLQDFVLDTLHILPFKSLVLLLIGEKGNAKEMLWCSRKCLGFATLKSDFPSWLCDLK